MTLLDTVMMQPASAVLQLVPTKCLQANVVPWMILGLYLLKSQAYLFESKIKDTSCYTVIFKIALRQMGLP